jgi:hypothetical protein
MRQEALEEEKRMKHPVISLRQASRRALCVLLTVLGLSWIWSPSPALAQVDQGTITGVVTDSMGRALPGAKVMLSNVDTGLVLADQTDATGSYTFSPVKIGNYTVSVSAPGFETTTQENVHLDIQQRLDLPMVLKVGTVSESVTVKGAPPALQTDTSSVGQVVDTDTINSTPLNGRNWVYIAQFTAGVAPGLSAGGARGGGTGDFSANGQRTTQNNFILDGVDNNVNVDDFLNGASYNVKPPPDALAEFKIDTSDYSAEFGHSAGAVLSASLKSGTNQFHGDLWEYVRNTRLDAADWDSAGGVPAYHENQFGATLGGPIWKNKLFYFGDAEANRIAFAAPDPGLTVPTASERQGDFSEMFDGNINKVGSPIGIFAPNSGGQVALTQTGAVPNPAASNSSQCGTYATLCAWDPNNPGTNLSQYGAATTNVESPNDPSVGGMVDTVAGEILAKYPKPNAGGWNSSNYSVPASGNLFANYDVNVPIDDNTWQWDQRLDWNISTKDQSYARYSYTHEQIRFAPPLGPVLDGGNEAPDGFHGGTNFNLAQNFMLSETHIFTPDFINEFRFGYNWGLYEFAQLNNNVPADQLIPGLGGVPSTGTTEPNGGLPYLRFAGSDGISTAGARRDVPSIERQNIYEILDNITKVHRNHSFKLGFELQSIRPSFAQAPLPRGYYNFDGQYSGKDNSTGGTVTNTGTGMADAFNDNMGSYQISPTWDTQYYRDYRAAYFQDDWKVNSRLTANLGVRYDFIQPDMSKPGDVANFLINSESVSTTATNSNYAIASGQYVLPAQVASSAVLSSEFMGLLASNNVSADYTNANPHSLTSVQHYNFAPRIGFAYQVGSKTVVRAAYGMFYGAIEAPGGAELETNYPFAYTAVLYNPYLGNYGECFPSTETGYSNIQSQCPSNGTPDLAEVNGTPAPGASIPAGWVPFPYTTTLETGVSNYTLHGGYANFGSSSALAMSDSNVKTPYTQSFNLTIERELTPTLIATVGYVGNNARHTFAGTQPLGPVAVTSSNDPNSALPFPSLGINNADMQWIGESMYNSLQAKLEKHYSNGASFLASYTYSHAEDDAANPGIGGGPSDRNTNLIPLKDEMTNSNYDTRHRITFNGLYDLPFGKGRAYLNQGGVLDYLVGGWSFDATWNAQTGIPFTVGPGSTFTPANGINQFNAIRVSDPFKGGGTAPAANVDMAGQTCPAHVRNRTNWYNPCAFVDPAQGSAITPGTVLTDLPDAILYAGGKSNQVYGPGWERVNMSGFKNFITWREQYVQFRADVFNLFNTPSLGQPSDTSLNYTGGMITNSEQFQNYTPDARFFQLSAKYVF